MKDPQTEHWLTLRQYPFEYVPSIPLKSVQVTLDAIEQIRLGVKVDMEHVGSLKVAIQDGADPPAIVVFREGDVYKLLDGIHRSTAYVELGRHTVDAYIVDVSAQDEVEIIRRSINLTNGKNLDPKERLIQAKHLKIAMGWTTAHAAREYGLHESTVSTSLAADESVVRIVGVVKASETEITKLFPNVTLARLRDLQRDDLVQAIYDVAKRTQSREGRPMPGVALEMLIADAKKVVTDSAATALVKKWAMDYPVKAKRPAKSSAPLPDEPPVIHLARVMAQRAITYLEQRLVKARLSIAQHRDAIKLVKWAHAELARLVVELEEGHGGGGKHIESADGTRSRAGRAQRARARRVASEGRDVSS